MSPVSNWSRRSPSSAQDDAARELVFAVTLVDEEALAGRHYRHEFRPGEPLAAAVRRACFGELARAHRALHGDDRTEGVHTARKAMKRTRAMLRLVRDQVGHDAYRQENVALRDAARRLSAARSAFVVARTAEQVATTLPLVLPPQAGGDLVARLNVRHALIERAVFDSGAAASVTATIEEANAHISLWGLEAERGYFRGPSLRIPNEFSSMKRGIRRVYRRGRRAMRRTLAAPTTETFHAWRKRVRYLRYQIEALHLLWPPVLGATAAELQSLAEALGAEHDLAELAELMEREPELLPHPGHRSALAAAVGARRQRIQASAERIGFRIYAEHPDRFVARMQAYWEAAQRHQYG